MRGISGSGKSTCAQHLMNKLHNENVSVDVFGADQYFYKTVEGSEEPQYLFSRDELGRAHQYCRESFKESGAYCVIIDNTNCAYNEMKWYMDYCIMNGIQLLFCGVDNFKDDVTLFNSNVHGVPLDTIQRQKQKFTPTHETIANYIIRYKKHFDSISLVEPHEDDLC